LPTKNRDKRLIIVGGDGTFHEALQGAVHGHGEMGIVPAGSGNDLIRALGLPQNPREVLEILGQKRVRTIDLGRIGHVYFVNGAGIGYDAKVTWDVNEKKGLFRGSMAYTAAIIKNILFFPGIEVDIVGEDFSWQKKILCLTAGNGPYLGGGIPVVPQADFSDGLLSFSIIDDISIPMRIRYLRKVLRGEHAGESFVTMFHAKSLLVKGQRELLFHEDGEVYSAKTVLFEIVPQALRLLG